MITLWAVMLPFHGGQVHPSGLRMTIPENASAAIDLGISSTRFEYGQRHIRTTDATARKIL